MKINEIMSKVYHVKFETQEELCNTFLRFQEYYESPKFRNSIFTKKEYKNWYKKEYGSWSYLTDWSGFNIPGYILNPFKAGLFNPLDKLESNFLKHFMDLSGRFYIIGTYGEDYLALDHELAHAMFYVDSQYCDKVLSILENYTNLDLIFDFLKKKGYSKEVFMDESNAYLSTDSEYLDDLGVRYDLSIRDLLYNTYLEYKEKTVKVKK